MTKCTVTIVFGFFVTFITNTFMRKPNKDGWFRKEVENTRKEAKHLF